MIKKMIKIVMWCLLLGYLVVSLSFVSDKRHELPIKEIRVKVLDQNSYGFVNNADVLKIVEAVLPDWKDRSVVSIDKNKLEQQIENNAFIATAEVYGLMSGDMVIEVTQRKPVARIVAGKGYYIDSIGSKIPLSKHFTSRVLIVSGNVQKQTISEDFVKLINYINADKFWQSQITQIDVAKNGELILIPRVGNHKIEFGTVENYRKKFRNLLALYNKGFSKTGWNKYSKINLKYSNQIVCTKK